MRIGLNLLYLIPGEVGGTETYAVSLLDGLSRVDTENHFVVFLNRESRDLKLPRTRRFSIIVCPVDANNRSVRFLWEQFILPFQTFFARVDVLHSLGYIGPLISPCTTVVTIHDLNWIAAPENFTTITRKMQGFFVTMSARRARRIIAVSSFVKGEINSRLKVEQNKIDVVYEAAKTRELGLRSDDTWMDLQRALGISKPFVFVFSSLTLHKNIPRLLEAFGMLCRRRPGAYQLVVVGHHPRGGPSLVSIADQLGLTQSEIVFTGHLTDSEVALLLKHARCFVFPSLYEGLVFQS